MSLKRKECKLTFTVAARSKLDRIADDTEATLFGSSEVHL